MVSSYNFLLLFKDYLHGLDKTQYEADLAEAGIFIFDDNVCIFLVSDLRFS